MTRDALAPAVRARLLEYLGALPNAAAANLIAALEREGALNADIPTDAVLDDLRTELLSRSAPFPPRRLTARRLFFAPFEDFFVLNREGAKRRGRIARSSIAPIWDLIAGDPAFARAALAAQALDAAVVSGEDLEGPESELFAAAREGFQVLLAGTEDETDRERAARAVGDEKSAADLREIAALLPHVAHLKAMQRAFPRPVGRLGEEDLYEARRLYAAAKASAPDAASHLLILLVGRLARPAGALRLYYHLLSARDLEGVERDAAALAEILIDDLEDAARRLERAGEGEFDADAATRSVRHFADFSADLAEEARAANDGALLAEIEACRDIAADALSRFAELALANLRRALPRREARGSMRLAAARPDYRRRPPPATSDAGRAGAEFLAGAETLAHGLERQGAVAAIVRDAVDATRRYLADLVVEIRAAESADRTAARRLMERALAASAPLLADDEIATIQTRAAEAAATA